MVALKSDVTVKDAINYESWLASISPGRTRKDMKVIRRACKVAQKAHATQKRASGEPYFLHSLAVANILTDLRLDHETISAALLHDVPEDTEVTLQEVEKKFGSTIATLVDGVTKMEHIGQMHGQSEKSKKEQAKAETLRKMMLAMVDDIRVVLIKLADRTHNMRTLGFTKEHKRKRVARETMDIFAPLANRLGIWQIKWELEDRSFRYLEPEIYKEISRLVDERRVLRESYLNDVIVCLRKKLKKNGVKANITGRPKHIYSIWKKMRRKEVDFDQIYDVRAVRVIVETLSDCYATLGVVHSEWRPIQGEFDDYIAAPKDNMYRSLHTAVIGPAGNPLEIQIRTKKMHQDAELGVAAHWRYKEGTRPSSSFDQKISWLRQLIDWKDEVATAADFIDNVKNEVFQDRVHVFTPKGDIRELPSGSTPIDFAYNIHTEVGHRCRGAKANGRIVPLSYKLKNGDKIEILTTKRGGPSRDWLNVDFGYLRSSRAKSKVRYWFKHQNYGENLTNGRSILERHLQRLGLPKSNYDKLARKFSYRKIDDFLAAIGHGDVTTPQIVTAINDVFPQTLPLQEQVKSLPSQAPKSTSPGATPGVTINGVGNLLTNIAQCCRPVPGGDEIVGYITRGRGVTIHRKDCTNVLRHNEGTSERLIEVEWNTAKDATFSADIEIFAFDRACLLRDVTAVVASERINFVAANVVTDKRKHNAIIYATIEITNLDQLSRVLLSIEQVANVVSAQRKH
ncbi:GTP diphosphokinase [Anaerolineales bacterium HSG6]|nr:GTP diphosphokinase [Anaerolineales bacterium HSG6]MDM8529900.1 GTP diphosphokinase [Anaerolineales bacterium HSG25]